MPTLERYEKTHECKIPPIQALNELWLSHLVIKSHSATSELTVKRIHVARAYSWRNNDMSQSVSQYFLREQLNSYELY